MEIKFQTFLTMNSQSSRQSLKEGDGRARFYLSGFVLREVLNRRVILSLTFWGGIWIIASLFWEVRYDDPIYYSSSSITVFFITSCYNNCSIRSRFNPGTRDIVSSHGYSYPLLQTTTTLASYQTIIYSVLYFCTCHYYYYL